MNQKSDSSSHEVKFRDSSDVRVMHGMTTKLRLRHEVLDPVLRCDQQARGDRRLHGLPKLPFRCDLRKVRRIHRQEQDLPDVQPIGLPRRPRSGRSTTQKPTCSARTSTPPRPLPPPAKQLKAAPTASPPAPHRWKIAHAARGVDGPVPVPW